MKTSEVVNLVSQWIFVLNSVKHATSSKWGTLVTPANNSENIFIIYVIDLSNKNKM